MAVDKPQLPYSLDALAPSISAKTLEFHYGKHHLGYWTKLNGMLAGTADEKKSLTDMVKTTEGVLFNQAAQTFNHSFYWNSMKPNPGGNDNAPTGAIADAITRDFGSFEKFKEEFSAVAAGHFGSGWAWLVEKAGKLSVLGTHDADCPLKGNRGTPLLCCDVWEHAYYLDYQNARPDYIKAWWRLVNWDFANSNLQKC